MTEKQAHVYVKICGITTLEDALASVQVGADMLGLNFYAPSPRYLQPEAAQTLVAKFREALGDKMPLLVGVFVNESAEKIAEIVQSVGLDYAQLSGDEPVSTLESLGGIAFKALRPRSLQDALTETATFSADEIAHNAPSLLVDAHNPKLYGGTGERASTEIALAVKVNTPRLMLAGGLNPYNVGEAVQAIRPWGVDVASGVESSQAGRKDSEKVKAFIAAVRTAEKTLVP